MRKIFALCLVLALTFSLCACTASQSAGKASEQTGLKVSNLYIAQTKKKCGLELGENFNLPKSENAKQPQCPEDKERAIVEALKHFKMVE